MADDDDKRPGAKSEPPRQLELPFSTPQEHAEFFAIIRQLEDGTLTADQARKRVLMLYDVGLGAWVRALGRSFPLIASGVTKGLLRDLEQVARNIESDADQAEDDAGRRRGKPQRPPRLTVKTMGVLEREAIVLKALLRANEDMTLADLCRAVEDGEPDIDAATLAANLDRLDRTGVIERPRKGYYAKTANSKEYLAALEKEIAARGSGKR